MVDKSAFDIDKCDGIEVLRFATGRSGFLSIPSPTPRLQKGPDQGSYHLRTNSLAGLHTKIVSDSKKFSHTVHAKPFALNLLR